MSIAAEAIKNYEETMNCETCRYYDKENKICTHPQLGDILTHFLDDPSEYCPFWVPWWEKYQEGGEGD